MNAVPTPIVPWETVVRLSDPIHKPSRQRLRTLQLARTASKGIRVVKRLRGRASGSATYYSAVTAMAAAVRQGGDEQTAKRLSEFGSKIESRFADVLREYLQESSVDDLADAPFYGDLIRETHNALDLMTRNLDDGSLIIGEVKSSRDEFTQIDVEYRGQPARVDLPTSLLKQYHMRPGDAVWILRRLVDSAALLMVLPAVSAKDVEIFIGLGSDAGYVRDEEKVGYEYLTSGPGAPIRQAEADFLASLSDDELPTARVLRLAG